MSQTLLLNDIRKWTKHELAERWQEAIVQLISKLHDPDDTSDDILKTIYMLLIPSVPLECLESSILLEVYEKTSVVYELLLNFSLSERERLSSSEHPPDSVDRSLQSCIEIISGLDSYVNHLSAVAVGVGIRLRHLLTLPNCIISLINKSYVHCKESELSYGEWFQAVAERLSMLFKFVHRLQTSFTNLLDKLDVTDLSAQETKDLCNVVESLSSLSEVASHLDIKVTIALWKVISRLSCQQKNNFVEFIDIDTILLRLCGNMDSTLKTLRLSPLELSVEAQNKSIKILGFQMKVLVALVTEYVDLLTGCVGCIHLLIVQINSVMHDSSDGRIPEANRAELRRQVCVGLEPLITILVNNRDYACHVTSTATLVDEEDGYELARFVAYLSVLRVLLRTDEDTRASFITPINGSECERKDILELVFRSFSKCYFDLCLPTFFPGVMIGGKPLREVSLYEYACYHVCSFVASVPAKHFATVENCLVSHVLGRNLHAALLAVDTWCFIGRYGSAELCRDHCQFLVSLYCQRRLPLILPESCHLVLLIRRMIGLMSSAHQGELFSGLSVEDCCKLFAVIPFSVVQSPALKQKLLVPIMSRCCSVVEHWTAENGHNVAAEVILEDALGCIAELISSQSFQLLSTEQRQKLFDCVCSLLPMAMNYDERPRDVIIARLLRVVAQLMSEASSDFINTCLSHCCDLTSKPDVNDVIKLSVLDLLSPLATTVFPPSAEQVHTLRLIAQLFSRLLSDEKSPFIRQKTIEVFANFAEKTAHESIVSESLMGDDGIRHSVVNYLNELASGACELYSDVRFLRVQHRYLVDYWRLSSDTTRSPTNDIDSAITVEPKKKKMKINEDVAGQESESKLNVAIDQIHVGLQTLKEVKATVGSLPSSAVGRLSDFTLQLETLIDVQT